VIIYKKILQDKKQWKPPIKRDKEGITPQALDREGAGRPATAYVLPS
jgi:hypothetical protein